MAEKIRLNEFLKELVKSLNKKFDSFENDIGLLKSEVERVKTNQKRESLNDIKERINRIENSLRTSRDLDMVDKSILKMLESEESARRT